jgi:hypothetical protein
LATRKEMSADPPQDTNGADGSEEPAQDDDASVENQMLGVEAGRGARKRNAKKSCVCIRLCQ